MGTRHWIKPRVIFGDIEDQWPRRADILDFVGAAANESWLACYCELGTGATIRTGMRLRWDTLVTNTTSSRYASLFARRKAHRSKDKALETASHQLKAPVKPNIASSVVDPAVMGFPKADGVGELLGVELRELLT